MIDSSRSKNDSIQVQTADTGAPYLMLAVDQVAQVRVLFDGVGLPYTIDERKTTAVGEEPLVALMFENQVSVEEIQAVLDGIDKHLA